MTNRRGGLPLFEAENGRVKGRCRECGSPVPKGRVSWCGDDCVQAHALRTDPNAQRLAVFGRDRGVCSECGLDCVKLRGKIRPLTSKGLVAITILGSYRSNGNALPEFYCDRFGASQAAAIDRACDLVMELGLLSHIGHRSTFWDMDHKVPLWEGGTNEINNLRTLCIPCHRVATRDGASKRASQRRQA